MLGPLGAHAGRDCALDRRRSRAPAWVRTNPVERVGRRCQPWTRSSSPSMKRASAQPARGRPRMPRGLCQGASPTRDFWPFGDWRTQPTIGAPVPTLHAPKLLSDRREPRGARGHPASTVALDRHKGYTRLSRVFSCAATTVSPACADRRTCSEPDIHRHSARLSPFQMIGDLAGPSRSGCDR